MFALLLNLPWELLQAPLYQGMASMPHWLAVKACVRATLGDAGIVLLMYWLAAARYGRAWIVSPSRSAMAAFVVGVAMAVAIEWLATHGFWLEQWTYSVDMPVLPGLGVGIVPVAQWVALPPLVVVLARRQRGECAIRCM